MLDNNNYKNLPCAFAEQIVSYLYGEANAQENTVFESHLNSCAACAEEFAGFTAIRSSVIEWRNEDFSSLETPLIEIPFKNPREFYNSENGSTISRSWFAEFRRIFTLSPARIASISFALIVFCVGIIFFINKTSNNVDVAVSNSENTEKIISSPKADKEIISNKESIASLSKEKNSVPNTTFKPKVFRKNPTAKAVNSSAISTKGANQAANARIVKAANTGSKTPTFAQARKTLRLNDVEDEEDKSLRLAEMLDGGDSD